MGITRYFVVFCHTLYSYTIYIIRLKNSLALIQLSIGSDLTHIELCSPLIRRYSIVRPNTE